MNAPSDPDEVVLEFEAVSKWYGPVIGLNQVSLKLQGGITGLVGSNGAGKSTLLRLATGQLKPSIGRVLVRGEDAWTWRAKALVGYCPDNDAFYEDMTGRDFVRAMARLCGFGAADANHRTEEVLARVTMTDRADRQLRGYSKGMRQRIKLAQALLNDPRLLVLDEPLSGIDPIGRQEMLELFRGLAAEGKCLLVSSHELEELEKLTDHVAILARGRIAALGTVSRIRDLLDDQPLSIRIDADDPRRLATMLLSRPDIVGVDFPTPQTLIVRARNPRRFFEDFNELATDETLRITRLEPLDDSTHAILGYLLGGSGKT
ncbi:ABC transporter ATP-binding protein [Zavarzinella formosa]|uniref:ABC transporter ATP-binding protein n=1 Tax=Zavarzinella formosa TaxID=360055 RepID=UPI0002D66A48|nr:ABC transporter ATP-binding protein [Zavarzinella formosa]